MSDEESKWVALGSKGLFAKINPLGAQLSVLRDSTGRDLLWNGDPTVWNGRAPVLFPIVGALAGGVYRLGSTKYALSRHGFARGKLFEIIEATPTSAAFRLEADALTLALYPYRFELEVRFALREATLSLAAFARNKGEENMPASFGYHPAFRWPLPFGNSRSSHFIEFDRDEPSPIRRLDSDGLLTPILHATPIHGRRLALEDSLFEDDAVIFDQIQSRSATYGAERGPRIRVSFPDAPYLGVWTKPKANFICIEPWHGIADPEGFAADFTKKPGVFTVAPGAAAEMKVEITLIPD
jgi:galactose mutarotase-like enzyme